MPANVPAGRVVPGNKNTIKWEKAGREEKVKANCVSETMVGLMRTGLEGRMSPNGGAVDMDTLLGYDTKYKLGTILEHVLNRSCKSQKLKTNLSEQNEQTSNNKKSSSIS